MKMRHMKPNIILSIIVWIFRPSEYRRASIGMTYVLWIAALRACFPDTMTGDVMAITAGTSLAVLLILGVVFNKLDEKGLI